MVIIGFIAVFLLGLYCLFAALAGAYVSLGFTGRVDWVHFIVCGGFGAALWYYAFTHSPLHISIST
jgi:hypothetical protein